MGEKDFQKQKKMPQKLRVFSAGEICVAWNEVHFDLGLIKSIYFYEDML